MTGAVPSLNRLRALLPDPSFCSPCLTLFTVCLEIQLLSLSCLSGSRDKADRLSEGVGASQILCPAAKSAAGSISEANRRTGISAHEERPPPAGAEEVLGGCESESQVHLCFPLSTHLPRPKNPPLSLGMKDGPCSCEKTHTLCYV